MIGGNMRYRWSSWKTSYASSTQTKGLDFHISLKNGRARSASYELLHIFDEGRRPDCFDRLDLLHVSPNSPV
jgi:hypothetical protein